MPKGQRWLIDKMKKLGYNDDLFDDLDGQCYGIASMAMQAFLLGELDKFNERIDKIEKITDRDIDKIRNGRIGDSIESFSEEENFTALDLLAFLDGVQLYQSPNNYSDILSGSQANHPAVNYVYSGSFENKSTLVKNFCGAYDDNELSIYLQELAQHLTVPTSILLSSRNHTINLNYDPSIQVWYFIDANFLPTKIAIQGKEEFIAKLIQRSLRSVGIYGINVLQTRMFTQNSAKTELLENIDALSKSIAWQNIHNLSKKDIAHSNLCCFAARANDAATIRNITSCNIDLNKPDENGRTAVAISAQNGYAEIIEVLAQHGANLNTYDRDGYTPAHRAIEKHHTSVINILSRYGANFYARDRIGYSPIAIAFSEKNTEIIKILIENKSLDPNKKIYLGSWDYPIHIATTEGLAEIVSMLAENKADLNFKDINGYTPAYFAAQNGHVEILRILEKNGVDLSRQAFALAAVAAKNGHSEVVLFLSNHLEKIESLKNMSLNENLDHIRQNYIKKIEDIKFDISTEELELLTIVFTHLVKYQTLIPSATQTLEQHYKTGNAILLKELFISLSHIDNTFHANNTRKAELSELKKTNVADRNTPSPKK